LPQFHPGLQRQRHQLIPRPLLEAGIRRIGDVLFYHCRMHRHALDTVLIDGTGFLPGPARIVWVSIHSAFGAALGPMAHHASPSPIRPRQRVRLDSGAMLEKVSPVKC
jgi:hypothetical protein